MTVGFGAFGKMPALGDFFRLNTPPGFVRVWDEWLQSAMMTGSAAGGDAWDDNYMSAPIWRFTLSPGLAGAAKVLGVLMPSVDRVGRRFPLSLMTTIEHDGSATLDHLSQDALFDQLENVALAALDDGMDREALTASLAEVSDPISRSAAPFRRAGTALVMRRTHPNSIAPDLAAALIAEEGMSAPSLWSAVLEDSRRAMICDGMPDAHQAQALFDLNAPLWNDARPQL